MTPTRRTALVAALVAVAVVAVAVVAFVAGRNGGRPPAGSATRTVVPTSIASPSPTYAPTDREGSPEPALPRGGAEAGRGGTVKGPAGLPLRYPQEETGAVSAATNYLIWMNSIKIADKSAADAMATAVAADPATRSALINSFDLLRSGMENLTADQPEPARGAYAIAAYSTNRALIYIWAPEVTTDANGQTDHVWAIDAVALVWLSGDWKLDQALITKVGGAAVDPADPAGNPSAEEKHSILTRTPADPGEITDSADQTWFEYANAPH